MAWGSLVGFALVAISVSFGASLLLIGLNALASGWLRRRGFLAVRRAAALALALPPVFGVGFASLIAAEKGFAWMNGADHCLVHAHHLHLCPVHGAAWAGVPWAVAVVGVVVVHLSMRTVRVAWAHVSAHSAVRTLKRTGEILGGAPVEAFLVPSDACFAFTVGLMRPAVIVSTGAWAALGEQERLALLAHESEHVARSDIRKRALLSVLTAVGLPGLADATLTRWSRATEHASDAAAARAVGCPSVVASALVKLASSRSPSTRFPAKACAADADVEARVLALLAAKPEPGVGLATLTSLSLALTCLVLLATGFGAGTLHHAFETILG